MLTDPIVLDLPLSVQTSFETTQNFSEQAWISICFARYAENMIIRWAANYVPIQPGLEQNVAC